MALRTVTYESLLRGASALGGVKINAMLKDTNALLFEYINEAYRKGRENDWFPDFTVVELRYWRDGLWSAGTYPDGSIVYDATTEQYWINETGSSTTDVPSTTTTNDWTEPGDFARYISFTQMTGTNLATAETEIDAVFNIYQKDPSTEERHGGSAFRITNDGIRPVSDSFDKVYVEFRARQDDMSGMVEWDADDTYLVGEYVYYKGATIAGEAYKVIVATTAGQDPEDTPASFSQVSMPYILAPFIKHQALADWLAAGGGGSSVTGDTASNIQMQNYLQGRADRILENESYNLRMRSGQSTSYGIRQT